jgi:hypothetical protein
LAFRFLAEAFSCLIAANARQIEAILGVPYAYIGFSGVPHTYGWAAVAVPVIGEVVEARQLKAPSPDRNQEPEYPFGLTSQTSVAVSVS